MESVTQHRFAVAFSSGHVDPAAGIIKGVAVITAGALRAGDERNFKIDSTTLAQIAASAATYSGGLKVKMTHAGDAGDIVGYLTNFHIDGATLRADLHLLENSPQRAYILEIAQKIPDTFGLSVAFSGKPEKHGRDTFARCSEIYSADLVSEPAANPNGLFDVRRSIEKPHLNMDDSIKQEIAGIVAEQLKPFTEKLSKIESNSPDAKALTEQFTAKLNEAVTLAAQAASKQTLEAALAKLQLGVAPGAAAAASGEAAKAPETFEAVVAKLKTEGKKHNDALMLAMDTHPELYAAFRTRQNAGEVIRL